ncbi:MAG: multifunctional CCA addition/repair protein [Neisseriaceae bacterium]|nr:multifunctional CCA addition/repair protein [Neisseriaceae bacterium]
MSEVYLVGGAVRDSLLNLEVKDKDWVVVGSSVEEMLSQGFLLIGKDFPVFLHPQTHEEYALARTERKSGRGYTGFSVFSEPTVTLEEDLSRRDLTINAMAMDCSGRLIDPFGGEQDLSNGILRHVSPAFAEDPVRILRIARFAARLGFMVADETFELMRKMVKNGEVDYLVPERVWQEISRGLMENKPSYMFNVLRECGALAIILPEVNNLFGVPQREDYHPEIDSGIHTMMAVDYSAQNNFSLSERYAVLSHDLGKALTPPDILPKHYGHEEAGIGPLKKMNKRLNVPKECANLALMVARNHGLFHSVEILRSAKIVDILKSCDAFRQPERFLSAIKTGFADTRGRLNFENAPYPQYELWQQYLLACQKIDIASLIANVSNKSEIPNIIRQARIKTIKSLRNKMSD